MKIAALIALACSVQVAALADFSYTSARKTTGGVMAPMAGAAGNTLSKVYFKGQKMKTEEGDTARIIDFDAQTITTVNNARKIFTVHSFSEIADAGRTAPGITIDSKETGQRKTVNGFDAKELILTMDMDMSQGRGMGGKMQIEVDMWIASGVPGASEVRSFFQKNAARFPWSAMGGGNNASLQSAMAEIQKKIASMDGVTVEQVIRVKPAAGAPAMPQMTSAQSAQMDQARARLEAMKAQGGPQAAMAEQALARMGALTGSAGAPGGGPLIEMTVDSTGFSTNSIPDSVFAIPDGYQKTDAK